jgi:hypothetical protein
MIMYAGLQMAMSLGSPQRYSKARETLLYAVGGVVVSIAAYAIIRLLTTHL